MVWQRIVVLPCRAAEHGVRLPAALVLPSGAKRTRASALPASASAQELLSHIGAALLHPVVKPTCSSLRHLHID